jgi:hypothetical protein
MTVARAADEEPEPVDWRELESFSFGDSPALADELAALVLAGTKTATCSAVSDGASTEVGKRMVLSGSGKPLAVIETVELPNGGSTMSMQHLPTMRVKAIGALRIGERHTRDISPDWVSLPRTCCSTVNAFVW